MRLRIALASDVIVAVVCVVAASVSWHRGVHTSWYAPAADLPGFHSTYYSGSWIFFAAVLSAVAGVAVLDLVRRVRARRSNAGHHIPIGGMMKP